MLYVALLLLAAAATPLSKSAHALTHPVRAECVSVSGVHSGDRMVRVELCRKRLPSKHVQMRRRISNGETRRRGGGDAGVAECRPSCRLCHPSCRGCSPR